MDEVKVNSDNGCMRLHQPETTALSKATETPINGTNWTPEQFFEAQRLMRYYEGQEGIAHLNRAYIVYKTIYERGYLAGGYSTVEEWAHAEGKSKRSFMNLSALGKMATELLGAINELGIQDIEHAKLTLLLPELKEHIHDKEHVKEIIQETRQLGYRDLKAKYKHAPVQMDFRAILSKVTRPGKTIEFTGCIFPIDISPQNIYEIFGGRECRVHTYLLENDNG